MDELKIKSKMMTVLVSKLIKIAIRKKLGKDIDIKLNEVVVNVNEGKISIHLDADCRFDQDNLANLLKDLD